eukprot:TRINITY_DN4138_c0_g1_i2.p1 TRINITY_DN4138_c0_g1~~TRINITY_DN4138_c0_g1_i2.p1  ORF type:complete len:221 (-),score=32.49 TRINITY_DN4138_c0_g1_i2:62-724(-)
MMVEDFPDSENYKNAFAIRHEERSFIVFADSPLAKSQWISSFKQGLGESLRTPNIDIDRLAPLWMPDDATKHCLCCEIKFTTFNRRHHCRQCGIVVCGKCSNHDKYLAGKGKKVRVCTRCFEITPASQNGEESCRATTSDKYNESDDSSSTSSDSEFEVLFECTALHDYKPEKKKKSETKKLKFKTGDVLDVIYTDDSGWWVAELGGKRGWIPSSFCKKI